MKLSNTFLCIFLLALATLVIAEFSEDETEFSEESADKNEEDVEKSAKEPGSNRMRKFRK